MTKKDFATELAAAREFARLGGNIALKHFRKNPQARTKADGTWVTEADWAVEAQIRLRIARTFPEHNVLGEEEGLTAAGGGAAKQDLPTWIIDPIDGTNNYIAGIPIWAVLVGLRVDDESVVGVCHAPALGETYEGALGLGARMNGERIGVDTIDNLSQATFLYSSAKAMRARDLGLFLGEMTERAWRSRGFGDFWGHMLVARGAAHIMVEPELSIWDVAALQPIVAEAGGALTRLDGEGWIDRGSCLTTNAVLHHEVLRLVKETTPDWREEPQSTAT